MNIFIQKIDLAGENPVLSADAVPQEDGTLATRRSAARLSPAQPGIEGLQPSTCVEALWIVEVKRSQIAIDLTGWEVCAYVKAADGEEVEPIRGRVRGDRIIVSLSGLPAVLMTLALKLEKDGQKQTLAVLQLVPAAGGSQRGESNG